MEMCRSLDPNSSTYFFRIGFLTDETSEQSTLTPEELAQETTYRYLAFFFIIVIEIVFVILCWVAVINERRMWLYIWYGLSIVQFIAIGAVMGFLLKYPDGLQTTSLQFFVVGAANAVTHLATVVCAYLYSRAFGIGMPEVFQLRVGTEDEDDDTDSSQDDADSITRAESFNQDFS